MESLNVNQNNDIEKLLGGLEKVRVMICCDNHSIIGQTHYSSERRFLDMLNKDFFLGKQRITNFVIVTQALLMNPDGEKEQIESPCFVNKDSIIFIGTFDETKSTTSQKINLVNTYPWTEKSTISANMVFAGKYRLTGQIHSEPWALPIRSIESRDRFMPMTDVRVISEPELREINFDFVAVNKSHLSLFQIS